MKREHRDTIREVCAIICLISVGAVCIFLGGKNDSSNKAVPIPNSGPVPFASIIPVIEEAEPEDDSLDCIYRNGRYETRFKSENKRKDERHDNDSTKNANDETQE